MRRLLWPILLLLPALPRPAGAEVLKVALLFGNNRGERQELELLYAESDVSRLARVLKELGGFRAENVAVLQGGTAPEVREALITQNDRIRREQQDGGKEVLLFVYYSGHADAENLHLGDSLLSIDELRKLVRGSAATMRVLVLDACRSGALTRVKGFQPAAAFDVEIQDSLATEGTVLITSSTSGEDSQESDAYKGSIFSHHLITGLMGAADESGDGKVSLAEVYRYAHGQTVKSTSRTWAGTQHPTYQYDLKGKGDVVLTLLALDRADKAALVLAEPGEYLILSGSHRGAVVAEVFAGKPDRRVVLAPGRYFIRARRPDELREGSIDLRAREQHRLSTEGFERLRYARLVRKGSTGRRLSHGPMLQYLVRGEILSGLGLMHQVGLSYPLALRYLTIAPRLSYGRSSVRNAILRSTTDEVDVGAEASLVIDWWRFSFGAGLLLGGAWFYQHFETSGRAPDRASLAFWFGGIGSVSVDLFSGLYLSFSAEARSYVLKQQSQEGPAVATPLTFVFGAGVGLNF